MSTEEDMGVLMRTGEYCGVHVEYCGVQGKIWEDGEYIGGQRRACEY